MIENFLFLLIVLLLQLIAIILRIPLIHLLFALFGLLFSAVVQSEIAYPWFNVFVAFASVINILYLGLYKERD